MRQTHSCEISWIRYETYIYIYDHSRVTRQKVQIALSVTDFI